MKIDILGCLLMLLLILIQLCVHPLCNYYLAGHWGTEITRNNESLPPRAPDSLRETYMNTKDPNTDAGTRVSPGCLGSTEETKGEEQGVSKRQKCFKSSFH